MLTLFLLKQKVSIKLVGLNDVYVQMVVAAPSEMSARLMAEESKKRILQETKSWVSLSKTSCEVIGQAAPNVTPGVILFG